jgi:2-phospho-L-lactate transferase CofD
VVTVAADGGSSGRLRGELGILPPGDLRMALAALSGSDPSDASWSALFQYRFGGTGALAGHAVGNLLLAGLIEVLGDPVAALYGRDREQLIAGHENQPTYLLSDRSTKLSVLVAASVTTSPFGPAVIPTAPACLPSEFRLLSYHLVR